MPISVPYDDFLIESLKNRRRAKAYLNAALEDGDLRVFLMALRNVARARTSKATERRGVTDGLE
jgi:DNA-binding phage protein